MSGVDKIGKFPSFSDISIGEPQDEDLNKSNQVGGSYQDTTLITDFPSTETGGVGQPALPLPSLDTGMIMTLLMQLQSKIAQERIRTGKEEIEHQKLEMQKLHKARMQKLKEYWEKMEEAATKSTGFFSKLFSGLKKLFKGDIKGALQDLKEGFKANPFTAIMFGVALLATAALTLAMGPVGLLIGLAITGVIFGPQALTDPGVVKMIANAFGASQETVEKWCLGIAAAISLATMIAVTILSMGAGASAVVAIGFGAVIGLIEGGMLIESGIRGFQGLKATEGGLRASAEADKLQAFYEKLQEKLKRNMEDMRDVMESIANEMQKAMEMIMNQGQIQFSMAKI